jgi:phosphate transport system substrate-binding protein
LQQGTAHFAITEYPVQFQAKGVTKDNLPKTDVRDIVQIPVIAEPIAIAYFLPRHFHGLHLTGEVLAAIYLGHIRQWNDPRLTVLNPRMRLPDQPISPCHISEPSGATERFTRYLSSVSKEWHQKIGYGPSRDWPVGLGSRGSEPKYGDKGYVEGSILYVELGYAKKRNLPYAALRNRSGKFILPSISSTEATLKASIALLRQNLSSPLINKSGSNTYPIVGFSYLYTRKRQSNKDQAAQLQRFLHWSMTKGQQKSKRFSFAPLPNEIIKINRTTIASIK